MSRKTFIAEKIDLVDHHRLVPADYNPREMDPRTLRVLVRSLAQFGWVQPVVMNKRTGNIVGGHQRARANDHLIKTAKKAKADDYRKVPVIWVDVSLGEEKALNIALNQISGDWDFFKRAAADELRQNATFAQMTRKHHALSKGYRAPLSLKKFDFKDPEHLRAFTSRYGTRILDFGCGKGQEIDWLQKLGVNAHGFEPFRRKKGTDKLDVAISRAQAEEFLGLLRRGVKPETVFCNFVISSMASAKERSHVLTILQALTVRARQAIIAVRSTDDTCYEQVLGKVQAKKGGYLGIPDASEPGLIVTGAGTKRQKFQKFYDPDEFRTLLKRHWKQVEIVTLEPRDSSLIGICSDPKKLPPTRLNSALKFEFDLPINDEPLGLADAAIMVIKKWLSR